MSVRGKRSAVRISPILFETPVHLVSFVDDGGQTRYGHLLAEGVLDGMSSVLPELAFAPVLVPALSVKTLTSCASLPAIPVSAFASSDGGTKRQNGGLSIDFISFGIPAGAPSVLWVKLGKDVSSSSCDLVHTVAGILDPTLGTPEVATSIVVEGWKPCEHFLQSDADVEGGCVVIIRLTVTGAEQCMRTAHVLVASGYIVSTPFSVQGSTGPAQFARVTSTVLKWIKDTDVMTDLSSIVDQLPGLLHGSARRDALTPCPVSESKLAGVIYDSGFNVQRLMICWGMLAASLSRSLTESDVDAICQPLQSYIRLVRGFEGMRDSHGADAVDVPHLAKTLTYNAAPKLTAAQASNALNLFYWAAIHEDDATRAVPKDVARRALEMYIPFGHVILRKRAYRFNS